VPADPAEAHAWMLVAGAYFTAEDQAEAARNAEALAALAAALSEQQMERSREIAKNLRARIEERRKIEPLKTGPGESET